MLYETERLRARPWTLSEADLEAARSIYGDPEVTQTIGGQVFDTPETIRAHMNMRLERQARWGGRYGAWALERREDGAVVGTILLQPLPDRAHEDTADIETGWHLARRAWGKGYATEAARGMLAHARETTGLHVIHAVVEPSNQRSKAVAERLGFTACGRTQAYYGGLDLVWFRLALRVD